MNKKARILLAYLMAFAMIVTTFAGSGISARADEDVTSPLTTEAEEESIDMGATSEISSEEARTAEITADLQPAPLTQTGTVGTNISWEYDENSKTLTLTSKDSQENILDAQLGGDLDEDSPLKSITTTYDYQFTKVVFTDCKLTGSAAYLFNNLTQITEIDCSGLDTREVTDMMGMFCNCENLTRITFGDDFITSSANYMDYMFQNCRSLVELDLSGFKVHAGTEMLVDCIGLATLHTPKEQIDGYIYLPNSFEDDAGTKYESVRYNDTEKTLYRVSTDLQAYDIEWVSGTGKIRWKMHRETKNFQIKLTKINEGTHREIGNNSITTSLCKPDADGYYYYDFTKDIALSDIDARFRVKIRPIADNSSGEWGLWAYSDYRDYHIPATPMPAPASIVPSAVPGIFTVSSVPGAAVYLYELLEQSYDGSREDYCIFESSFNADEISSFYSVFEQIWADIAQQNILVNRYYNVREALASAHQQYPDDTFYWKARVIGTQIDDYTAGNYITSETFSYVAPKPGMTNGTYSAPTVLGWEDNWFLSFVNYTEDIEYFEFEYQKKNETQTDIEQKWANGDNVIGLRRYQGAPYMLQNGVDGTDYRVRVRAITGEYEDTVRGEWSNWSDYRTYHKATTPLGTTTPTWDPKRPGWVTFTPVSNAGRYDITIYKLDENGAIPVNNSGYKIGWTNGCVEGTYETDFRDVIRDQGDGIYVATVTAYSGNIDYYTDGPEGPLSDEYDSAASKQPLDDPSNLTWDKYTAKWDIPSSAKNGDYITCYLYYKDEASGKDINIAGAGAPVSDGYFISDHNFMPDFYDTGDYYFTVQIDPGSNDYTHRGSNVIKSAIKHYDRPSTELETTVATWDPTRPGVLIFDPVPNASQYQAELFRQRDDGTDWGRGTNGWSVGSTPEIDYKWLIDRNDSWYGPGKYRVKVRAISSDIGTLANGDYGDFSDYYDSGTTSGTNDLNELKKAPKNVRWDGYTAKWTNDPRISFYWLDLKNETTGEEISPVWLQNSRKNGDYSQPLSNAFEKSGDYSFRAYATWAYISGTDGEDVSLSNPEKSAWVKVHYDRPNKELGSTTITLGSKPGTLTFTAVPNAAGYEISLHKKNDRSSDNVIDNWTPWNDMIDMEDNGYGVWWANAEKTVISVDFTKYNNFDIDDGTYWCEVRAISDDIDTLANGQNVVKYINEKVIPKTSTITYMDGTTTLNNLTPKTYTEGTAVTLPTPTKAGYVFKGWYENADCTGTAVTSIPATATGNKTFYAKWEAAKTFTITYMDGETKLTDLTPATYTEGTAATLPTPVKEDYAFKGWFEKADFTGTAVTTIAAGATGDKTFYARWKILTYTVTFNTNGGSDVEDQTVEIGKKATRPTENPKKDGYTFDGWYADANFATVFDFDAGIKKDTTIYAKWSEIQKGVFWVEPINPQTYTGSAIKPEVKVYDGTTLLKEKTDYTLTYKNNTKANDATSENTAPYVLVTGKGNYSGSQKATFVIRPRNLTDEDIVAGELLATQTNNPQHPVPAIKFGGKALRNNTDFTVDYPDQGANAYQEAGVYKVKVTGKDNFTGELVLDFTITTATLISKAKIASISRKPYTGEEIKPTVKVTLGRDTLVKDTDYTVEYQNNINAGTATVIITGIGNFAGTKEVSFTITGTSVSAFKISGIKNKTYNGEEQTQDLEVTLRKNGEALSENEDYTVSYSKNVNVGTATVTITGAGRYTGSVKKTFRIKAYNIKNDLVGEGLETTVSYVKGGCTPEVSLTFDGEEMVLKKDFTVTYSNNKKVASADDRVKPTITVNGKGNFTGKRTIYFNIVAKDLSDDDDPVFMFAPDVKYLNKATNYKTTPVLIDSNGKKLVAGTDYERKMEYSLADGTVLEKNTLAVGTVVSVTVTGKKNYEGSLTATYVLAEKSFSSAQIKISSQEYTGEAVTLQPEDITVTLGKNNTLSYGTDYVIAEGSYLNNVKKGTASVIIKGMGDYAGYKTVKFSITAKEINIKTN